MTPTILAIALAIAQPATAADAAPTHIALNVVGGVVHVYLPGTLSAGDRIAGSMFVQPIGNDWDMQNRNMLALESYTLNVGNSSAKVSRAMISANVVGSQLPISLVGGIL